MNELKELIAESGKHPVDRIIPAILRLLADQHAKQAEKWRKNAESLPEEDRYLKGYIDCLNDMAIGSRRLAIMSERGEDW